MPAGKDREEMRQLDPDVLRSIIRERTHHTVEVVLYPAICGGGELSSGVGQQVRDLLEVWRERGLPEDLPDIQWSKDLLQAAEAVQEGREPDLELIGPCPYDEEEMGVVDDLIFSRRSIRKFTDEDVGEDIIDSLLEAALWAPHACNLQSLRFLVLRTEEELSLINFDVSGYRALIIAGQDSRIYEANPHVPEHNRLLDCGAAVQNIVLMAHALGLGACWGTFREKQTRKVREHFDVAEYIDLVTCVALGWPDEKVVPPARMDTDEVLLNPLDDAD